MMVNEDTVQEFKKIFIIIKRRMKKEMVIRMREANGNCCVKKKKIKPKSWNPQDDSALG